MVCWGLSATGRGEDAPPGRVEELARRLDPTRPTNGDRSLPVLDRRATPGSHDGPWRPLTVAGDVVSGAIAADGVAARLVVEADDEELDADGADMTRVVLRFRDESGHVLPRAARPVSLAVAGPGVLIGENPHPMPGGRGAVSFDPRGSRGRSR